MHSFPQEEPDMQDDEKTKEQLIDELKERTAELMRIHDLLTKEMGDREASEEFLGTASAYNRCLIETSVDPLVTISAEGKISDVNTATEKVTGRSRDELIGTEFSDYFTDPERARVGYQQVFKDGLVKDYELEIQHRDGDVTPVTYSASVYRDESGEVVGVFAAARDITMRKLAEEVLKRSHDQLEQRVRERTAELHSTNEELLREIEDRKRAEQEKENLRAQLLQSQKMETMGTLAGGIAHDFNNMLQVIFSYSDMLLADKNEGDPGYEELQKIVKTSEDAADLVQRIRIFGRKAEMNLIPLDLNHQVDEVTKLLSRTLPKMIEMDIHLAKDTVIIRADSSQIAQMVMNLAVNAGEAMPQGGRLSIQTENIVLDDDYCRLLMGVKPGPHVMLTVSDTGRGIDKGLMERIFDPFYSTKMRDYHKGTGLGLSVVQGIVQQHGGHITVESEVGQGTTFRMYFPALEVEILPEYVEWKIPYPAGGTETILLVEDWEMVRELGVTILEKFGYTILSACDGQEALEVYEKEQGNISLVILDIIMPRMDGKECLVELLRINPAVKVIISSGVGHYDLINDIVKIGAKGAVNKPYSMRQLLGMVREVLDGD
jgi:PAS domain S-box-containing protein